MIIPEMLYQFFNFFLDTYGVELNVIGVGGILKKGNGKWQGGGSGFIILKKLKV